jgi:hypothetical protein
MILRISYKLIIFTLLLVLLHNQIMSQVNYQSGNDFSVIKQSNRNKVSIGILKQDVGMPKTISIQVIGQVGKYPNWDGLSDIILDMNIEIQKQLRNQIPYKIIPRQNIIKTNNLKDSSFVGLENLGNNLIVQVFLQECLQKERDWYSDFYLSIFPNNENDISLDQFYDNLQNRFKYIELDSKIKRIGNDIIELELNYPAKGLYKVVSNLVSGPRFKTDSDYEKSLIKIKELDTLTITKNIVVNNNIKKTQITFNKNNLYSHFIFKHRCNNCHGGKNFKGGFRRCPNCDYWTKDQRRFNYCNVCRNREIIEIGKSYFVACNICKQTGIISSKLNLNFKMLFEKYFTLDDSRKLGQDAMIYQLESESGTLTFTKLIDFNTLQFLCYSKGDRYVLQFKSNGDVIVVEFEGHLEKTNKIGSWEIDESTFSMTIPFKLKSWGDDRTLKITKFAN